MSTQAEPKHAGRRLSGGVIASLLGLAVLLIFIIQNRADVRIHFLAWSFVWPLWLYAIVMGVAGALLWSGLGVLRRRRRRRERQSQRY